MEIRDFFAPGSSRQIRMHHVALNRSRPNDRDFDDNIVKTFRLHPRQRRHLRAALDLKHANRVGVLHHLVGGWIVFRNVREIERTTTFATKFKRILHHRHHAESKQIDFYDPQVFAVIFVPLRDDAAGHRSIFQRHERTEFVLTNDHSAGVLTEMPRQAIDRWIQMNADMRGCFLRQTGLLDLRLQIERVRKIAVREEMRKTIENTRRKI